ncbi:MAG TPA: RpiB/LacA/LacB family sugar-phosphate isomerase [Candidatus Paceibacterota bacterium]|nr:RpiB/LacA/LacB family sugar-phosphate isomerase [Candidatus Paceibacterota bacterium]
MKIHLATDHAGFAHKEALKKMLIEGGYEIIDHGATTLDPYDDYPDFMTPCAEAVAADTESRGIIFGKSGEGEAMVSNRVRGVRAVVYYGGSDDIITLSRMHNDANMLSIGAGFVSVEETFRVVELWLATPFSGEERHVRRINKF